MAKSEKVETVEDEGAEQRQREGQYKEALSLRLYVHKSVDAGKVPDLVRGLEAHAKANGLGIRNRSSEANGNLAHPGKSGIVSIALESPESMERLLKVSGPSREVREMLTLLQQTDGATEAATARAKAAGLSLEDWVKQTIESAKRSALGL